MTGEQDRPAVTDQVWASLREEAIRVSRSAYAPYSGYPVGVAGLVNDGRVVSGCNVENASYGLGLCAECGLVSQLHATGGGRLCAVHCVNGAGAVIMPCGRCRQLLWENGGAGCLVMTPSGPRTMDEVLPDAFDAVALGTAVGRSPGEAPGAVGGGARHG